MLPSSEPAQPSIQAPGASTSSLGKFGVAFARTESVSSTSGGTSTHSGRTMDAGKDGSSGQLPLPTRPFVVRHGRTYLSDPTLSYPLPVDLPELHRQTLRTLLLLQLFNGPLCSYRLGARPPQRVLEVACGSGFWSVMCHRYFAEQGHTGISFTGIDVAPSDTASGIGSAAAGAAAASSSGGGSGNGDAPMAWRFVQHDLRRLPWPFANGEFDVVMVKDVSLATTTTMQQALIDEYIRVLRPGGVLEMWESDHTLRMLRPHARAGSVGPSSSSSGGALHNPVTPLSPPVPITPTTPANVNTSFSSITSTTSTSTSTSTASTSPDTPGPGIASAVATTTEDEQAMALSLGAYLITPQTPLSQPLNNHIVEYNSWVSRALEARGLSPIPCTLIGPLLLQEADSLVDVRSRRLALPLSDKVRWEVAPGKGTGAGKAAATPGVVVRDGKTYVETGSAAAAAGGEDGSGSGAGAVGKETSALTAAQAALRRTALLTVVQAIQALEPVLRETSGKSQDEWDLWVGKMMRDLVEGNGLGWGECLEVGAWWARKRKP